MTDAPRVAIIMPLARVHGGAEQTLVDLLSHRHQSRYEWRVIFLNEGPLVDDLRERGIPVQVIEVNRVRNVINLISVVRRIAAQLASWNCDAVLSWIAKGHIYGGLAALLTNLPAVWFQHAMPADISLVGRLATLIPARGVLCCSQAGAVAQSNVWPQRRTRVVYPGVNLDRFAPARLPDVATAREALDLPVDSPIVGIVGRLQRWKGMHTFIDAMHLVERHHPEVRGVIVGGKHQLEPDYPGMLRHQINRLGLQEKIFLVGRQANVPLWMQAMDIVVHASDREPFGLVVVEAMALKKPIVASSSGGPTEIISPGIDGLLAPFEHADTLAKQIDTLLENPSYARELGEAAGERAKDFSTAHFAAQLDQELAALLP